MQKLKNLENKNNFTLKLKKSIYCKLSDIICPNRDVFWNPLKHLRWSFSEKKFNGQKPLNTAEKKSIVD